MIAGMIGPKGRPGFLHPHRHGVINLVEPRKFVVDPAAERVIDEGADTLILTTEAYDAIRKEIAEGGSMFIEPVSGEESEALEDANREIAELRRLREQDQASFDAERAAVRQAIEQAAAEQEAIVADLHKQLEASATLLAGAQKRIAELEAQLAGAASPAPAAAPAPVAEDKAAAKKADAKKDK